MNFSVGQRVVHVGASNTGAPTVKPEFRLTKGEIYTIREIDFRAFNDGHHRWPTVRLIEVRRPIAQTSYGPWEVGYIPENFRPLDERKTDISIFTRMLTPKKQSVYSR